MIRLRSLVLIGSLLAGSLLSCSSDDSGDATATSAATPTARSVLDEASRAMADVRSASFTINQSGAQVFIDGDKVIRFSGATGRYAAPSAAQALVKVNALGLDTEIGAVAVGEEIRITNPLTGVWEAAPETLTFNPAKLFDADVGWSALLADGLQEPALLSEQPDGDGRYQMRAAIDGERVAVLTGGLVDEPSQIELWVDAEAFLVREAAFDVSIAAGNTSWQLLLEDYGTDVTITLPDIGSRG